MIRMLAAAIVLVLSVPAVAQQQHKPQPRTEDKEKLVCQVMTTTGSIVPKRTCKTQEQWDAEGAANREALEQIRRQRETLRIVSGT